MDHLNHFADHGLHYHVRAAFPRTYQDNANLYSALVHPPSPTVRPELERSLLRSTSQPPSAQSQVRPPARQLPPCQPLPHIPPPRLPRPVSTPSAPAHQRSPTAHTDPRQLRPSTPQLSAHQAAPEFPLAQ
jgi:hypothetical protein